MTYIHKRLAQGRWNRLSLIAQLANIGSEVERAILWREKKRQYSLMAFYRALELLSLTIDDSKNAGRLKELTRLYESLGDYFVGQNQYKSSDILWRKYFYPFAFAARNKI